MSYAERAFCFRDQYFVVDCTGFKIADSYGKLLLFSTVTLSIVNAPHTVDIPDPHEVIDHPPLIVAHTPGTSDLRNSPFNLYFCGVSLSLCLRAFETLITNEDFFPPFAFQRFRHAMRVTQGAFITGSVLNIILGFNGLWGIASR
jgi:hypothetical protein